MANTIKIKRGTNLSNAGTPEAGELIYKSDSNELFVGDGSTAATGLTAIGGSGSGDIEGVTAGTGLSGGGTSGTVSLAVDLSELTDMTASVNSSEDELIILDNGADRRKLISEIPLSAFNNDSGFITSTLTTEAVQDIVGAMFTSNTETRISATYQDGDGTIDLVVDDMTADTNTQLSTEQVQDIVGAMFSGNTETRITATYQDSDGTIDLVVDDLDTDTQLTTENVQDIVGAMFSSNTETRISATYQDGDGTIDLVVDDMTANDNTVTTNIAGTGIDVSSGTGNSTISVDVSDFMSNGSNNRIVTATGTDAMNAESNLTFDGTDLAIAATGKIYLDGGGNSYIQEESSDNLIFRAAGGNYLRVTGSNIVLNDPGASYDVRIEGDADSNLFFTDGSADKVGIGTNSPDTKLDITASGVQGVVINQDGSNADISSRLFFKEQNSTIALYNSGNTFSFRTGATINSTSGTERMHIDTSGIDVNGSVIADSLDISGDIDVDGTANFDAIDLDGHLDMRADDVDAARYIHMPRGGGITFYGDASQHHGIFSRNDSNTTAQDDLLITSYGAVYIDLDSNDNNTSNASFEIGKHNTANDPLFVVDGEDGQIRAEDGSASAPVYSFNADDNCGMFRVSSDVVGIAAAGNSRFTVKGNGIKAVSGSLGVNTDPNSTDGMIHATNDIVAFSSDKRLKENIRPIENALDKVSKLSGFVYNWNKLANEKAQYDMSKDYVGVYAQDVEEVQPEAVDLAPFDNDGEDKSISGDNYLTVKYDKLVPLLIESIKELKAEIEELKK